MLTTPKTNCDAHFCERQTAMVPIRPDSGPGELRLPFGESTVGERVSVFAREELCSHAGFYAQTSPSAATSCV